MRHLGNIESSLRNESQSRIRCPLVAQVRREIAAGEYAANEDDAIDRLIDSGDLDDRVEHAERWDGMS